MRINEILTERKSADLYHGTFSAAEILQSGNIEPQVSQMDNYDDPDRKIGRKFISLTRDFRFTKEMGYSVVFVIDQSKLTNSHKMRPIDEPMYADDPSYHLRRTASEERIYKAIPIAYIKQIIIINPEWENNIDTIEELAAKHNIPVIVKEGVTESLTEGKNHSVIVVDVQPEYSGMNDGDENAVFPEIINFVNNQTGPVLMLINAEETGITRDTINGVKQYWEDTIRDEVDEPEYDDDYADWFNGDSEEQEDQIDWSRFTIHDKGYGYIRSWMDIGMPENIIIKVIREMYQQKVYDSRELFDGDEAETYRADMEKLMGDHWVDYSLGDNISVGWASIKMLKEFNGSYIVGGGRNECLREVELLMNAFNIKYRRIDSLVYG